MTTLSLNEIGLLQWPAREDSGRLVVFEGLDGSGKSTQINLVFKQLASLGIDVITTRLPTDYYRNDPAVKLFMARGGSRADALALAEKSSQDCLMHVNAFVRPQLNAGKVILCDRYVFSFLALFEFRGVEQSELQKMARGIPRPDLVFFLDVSVHELSNRRNVRDGDKQNHEEKNSIDLSRIRGCYLKYKSEYNVLNGEIPASDITQQACSRIRAICGNDAR